MPDERSRGKLRIYLGYAAGVGKTYQMLEEAQALRLAGRDVVVGYFEPHARKDTIAKTGGLELVPRFQIDYRGAVFEEMNTDAILARKPEICVVDEFPHTNVPGSPRAKRWQDVEVLLNAGMDVFTTMNIQHLESLNDQVFQISGVRVRETIPDWVVKDADQVIMVDLTPRALLNRLMRGVVYSQEKAKQALDNFFKESTLGALRELALRQTAHEVEIRQADYGRTERILVYITADPSSAMLIRRAKRVADYLQADCFAVAVHRDPSLHSLTPEERDATGRHLNFARNLHLETRLLQGEDVPTALVEFARRNGITQIFIANSRRKGRASGLGRSLVQKVVQLARDMQVTVVADRATAAKA